MTERLFGLVLVLWHVVGVPSVAHAETDEPLKNSAWSVDRQIDPILDSLNITAHLRETGVKKSLFGNAKYLLIRCRERQLDAAVMWWGRSGALGAFDADSNVEVITRFDTGTPETETWPHSPRYHTSFAPLPGQFVRRLQRHQRLAVRRYTNKGRSLTAVFDLAEAQPIVQEVIEACEA